jgi:hypothetical protein
MLVVAFEHGLALLPLQLIAEAGRCVELHGQVLDRCARRWWPAATVALVAAYAGVRVE